MFGIRLQDGDDLRKILRGLSSLLYMIVALLLVVFFVVCGYVLYNPDSGSIKTCVVVESVPYVSDEDYDKVWITLETEDGNIIHRVYKSGIVSVGDTVAVKMKHNILKIGEE